MYSDIDSKIQGIVDSILNDVMEDHRYTDITDHKMIDRDVIVAILEKLETLLFPAYFSDKKLLGSIALRFELGSLLADVYTSLSEQIAMALSYLPAFKHNEAKRYEHAKAQTAVFLDKLTKIRSYLKTDIQAAYEGDPAAFNTDEIVYSYPGFYAIMVNRLAHELYLLDVPMIPRIMTEYAHSRTGLDIHPGATIGRYFFIDHATGVVIGETTVIGDHVKIYQGVTLGGLTTRAGQGLKGKRRHPTIGNNVTIYSNASILGGDTIIGDGCIIAGNTFITHSIEPNMRVSAKLNELKISQDPKAVAKPE